MAFGVLWLWGQPFPRSVSKALFILLSKKFQAADPFLKRGCCFWGKSVTIEERRHGMKKNIFGRLDDIRLGGKFLILFLACVVFPMITSNGYIIYSMKEGMDKQQEQRVGNIADRLEMELASEINRQLFIADYRSEEHTSELQSH